jgi:hypothetical protein
MTKTQVPQRRHTDPQPKRDERPDWLLNLAVRLEKRESERRFTGESITGFGALR